MRHRLSNGIEISGFIDYEESLRKSILDFEEGATDWVAIFKQSKRIWPKKTDLGYVLGQANIYEDILITVQNYRSYCNWRTGYSALNDSKNFKAITDPFCGLIFESRHDRQQLFTNPLSDPGSGSTRTMVKSINYDHVVLFDNVVRNKI